MRRLVYAVLGPLAAFMTIWHFGTVSGLAQPAPQPSAAGDQGSFRSVTDPNGRYTIEVPDRWVVAALPGGIRMAGITRWSMVAAAAPVPAGTVPINVVVLTVILQSGASPSAIVQHLRDSTFVPGESPTPGFKLLKTGPLTLAGRDAFYMYQTITAGQFATPPGLYQILVFVPDDEALFIIGGQAANSPDRIAEATPLLLNIINTFSSRNDAPDRSFARCFSPIVIVPLIRHAVEYKRRRSRSIGKRKSTITRRPNSS